MVNVVPSDPVVSVAPHALPDRERPLHLPRLLEQLEDASALRAVGQVRRPPGPIVPRAGVLVPVVLIPSVHRVRDDYHFAVFVSRQSSFESVADLPRHLARRAVPFHHGAARPANRATLVGFARCSNTLGVELVRTTRHSAHLHAVVLTLQANGAVIAGFERALQGNEELLNGLVVFPVVIEYGLLPGTGGRIIAVVVIHPGTIFNFTTRIKKYAALL